MFPMVTEFMNYGQQTVRAARCIGQGFMITLSHANCLPVTIQYPYEKLITSERFRGRIHFEFDKCIACEVCVRVCPIDLPVVDWKLETDIRNKRLLNSYCPTNCLSMTEEYELSTYDRHELNYNQIALGRRVVCYRSEMHTFVILTPGNYIEAHNWLKITRRFE
ncbi:putative NADH:ubiquinone reductase (H(+)-translocating) [Helianthus anomalus]